jgi:hypothetical protein
VEKKRQKKVKKVVVKKRKRSNSKSLGGQYERDFSKKLSYWLTGSEENLVVWRTLGSGSVGTQRRKKGFVDNAQSGDLQCLDLAYQPFFDTFYIDTKCYKEFNPLIINSKNIKSNKLFLQWVKTLEDCPEGRVSLMPIKVRDGSTPEIIFVENKCCFSKMNYMKYSVNYNDKTYNFYIVLLKEFFELNDWETLCKTNNP